MLCRKLQACLLMLVSYVLIATLLPPGNFCHAAYAESKSASQAESIYKQIGELVHEYYPKAKVEISDKGLHFEFKAKKGIGYYTNVPVLAPSDGGIVGDVTLKPGQYEGRDKDRLPCEEPAGFYTNLVSARYSKKENSHLLGLLSFPGDTPLDFKSKFKELIDDYAKDERIANEQPTKDKASRGAHQNSSSEKKLADTAHVSEVLPSNIIPGPYLDKRQLLVKEIEEARDKGVGVKAYIQEFNRIEEAIKSGKDDGLEQRIDSLADSIKKQDERAQILKTHLPSTVGSTSSSSAGNASATASGASSLSGPSLPAFQVNLPVRENLDPEYIEFRKPYEELSSWTSKANPRKSVPDTIACLKKAMKVYYPAYPGGQFGPGYPAHYGSSGVAMGLGNCYEWLNDYPSAIYWYKVVQERGEGGWPAEALRARTRCEKAMRTGTKTEFRSETWMGEFPPRGGQ